MLSEKQMNCLNVQQFPKLAQPVTVRIKFCKTGDLQYISHLDLQRTISRVLVRAGIPTWYTQGFNPHAKIIFGLPLSVGAESLCEYLDVRIDRDMPCDEIKRRLNGALTEQLHVLDVYLPASDSAFQHIVWATYDIRIRTGGLTQALANDMKSYLTTAPVVMEKKSKSGMRQVDITTLIRSLDAWVDETVESEQRELQIATTLCVSGSDYLNPEYLIRALKERFGILPEGDIQSEYRILRTKVLLRDGVTEFR